MVIPVWVYCRTKAIRTKKLLGWAPALGTGPKGENMLRWALIFFVVALVAAVFGFWGIVAAAAGIAKVLFFLFLVLFLVSLVGGLVRRA